MRQPGSSSIFCAALLQPESWPAYARQCRATAQLWETSFAKECVSHRVIERSGVYQPGAARRLVPVYIEGSMTYCQANPANLHSSHFDPRAGRCRRPNHGHHRHDPTTASRRARTDDDCCTHTMHTLPCSNVFKRANDQNYRSPQIQHLEDSAQRSRFCLPFP